MAKKNKKGQHVPYWDGVVCTVTIDDGNDGNTFKYDDKTTPTSCQLFDGNNTKVADWQIDSWTPHHNGRLTIVFTAVDPRSHRPHGPTDYIVIQTDMPSTTTDPGIITVEPVDINPCP
jgi:hypothetical protein